VGSNDVYLDKYCENQVCVHTTQTECRTKSQHKVSLYNCWKCDKVYIFCNDMSKSNFQWRTY